MEIRFIDMFCGIGGFRLGLEKANKQIGEVRGQVKSRQTRVGFSCVWANDNDRYACQIYRRYFGEVYEGDIRTVDVDAIPEHDLLCAGFPCQSFSIAGKRRGFEDTRGTLFFEICRVLRAKRPGYLFLENVKGLLSSDMGGTFHTILWQLDELGYDCQWQVLNSKDYGVPQNRERVFIIGYFRGKPRPKVFPIKGNDEVYNGETTPSGSHLKSPLRGQGDKPMIYDIYNEQLRANQELAGALKGEGIADTSLGTALILRDGRDNRSCLREGRTLELGIEGQSIRRLTPLECERLQGFPDGWTEGISDTQRYKCLGNAVTVNVIEAIGKQLLMELV